MLGEGLEGPAGVGLRSWSGHGPGDTVWDQGALEIAASKDCHHSPCFLSLQVSQCLSEQASDHVGWWGWCCANYTADDSPWLLESSPEPTDASGRSET